MTLHRLQSKLPGRRDLLTQPTGKRVFSASLNKTPNLQALDSSTTNNNYVLQADEVKPGSESVHGLYTTVG